MPALSLLTLHASLVASAWRPFVTPAPIWDLWWLLLVPLVVGVAVAYKATKSPSARRLPWDATTLSAYILGFFVVAAVGLAVFIEWLL